MCIVFLDIFGRVENGFEIHSQTVRVRGSGKISLLSSSLLIMFD